MVILRWLHYPHEHCLGRPGGSSQMLSTEEMSKISVGVDGGPESPNIRNLVNRRVL